LEKTPLAKAPLAKANAWLIRLIKAFWVFSLKSANISMIKPRKTSREKGVGI
jgi:hypothetical protein